MAALYQRILLKLSGESLMGSRDYGIDPAVLCAYADEVRDAVDLGVQVGIVLGGGNIYRGVAAAAQGIHKASGDQMGMLATMINSLALQNMLEARGITTRLASAIDMNQIAEPYIRRRVIRHLEKGRVVVLGAGTGHPYFTTDTAAALRAVEIEADVIVKGTRVDGVYDCDPETNPGATRFDRISYREVLDRNLRVMDLTAITLCGENAMPIIVFNITAPGNLRRLLLGEPVGTLVAAQTDPATPAS
jgi:uridylate kinase